jgi:hypothetical protein
MTMKNKILFFRILIIGVVVISLGITFNQTTRAQGTPTVSFTSASQSHDESVGSMTFTAQLSEVSGLDVQVPFTLSGTATQGTDYTITSSPLIISAGNPSADITITVNDDSIDENDETVIITMGTPTNATQGATTVHTATITDNDGAPTVSFTSASQSNNEAVGSMTVTAQLSATSGLDVQVPFTLSGTATQGTDYTITSSPLIISAGNPSADITITVNDDSIDESDETVIINMGTPTNATQGATTVHTATITDNDTAGITVDPTSGLTTTEAGGTDTFTIVLTSQPTANVTIGLSSSDITEGSVSPTSVTFTNLNWDSPQTVTVTGVDDSIADGSISYSIDTTVAASVDPIYNGMPVNNVSALNIDNDAAGIIVNPASGLLTTEAGGTATFTIVLTSQPTANVTIGLSSSDITEGTVSPASVTFTNLNWDTPRTVTVTGVDDNLADGNIDYTIVTAPATSIDTNYNTVNPADVSVINQDDDTAGITVNPTSGLITTEQPGGNDDFTVVLNTQPSADVTIGLSSSDTSEGLITKASLTFTPENWNVAQIVTVIGVDDDINDHDVSFKVITAQAGSSDPDYKNLDVPDVSVTNLDNDGCEIEWVSPIETKGFYKIGIDEEKITLEVRSVDKGCIITRVRFYRWDAVNEVHVQIGEVSKEPFRIILNIDPLNYDYNQIFAVAYDEDDNTSPHEWIFLQRFIFYFLPSVFR